MFYRNDHLYRSALLDLPGIFHGFSTREGGVSRLPHTASMNAAFFRGDDDETVRRNLTILAAEASGLPEDPSLLSSLVCGPQVHGRTVRRVGPANGGEGILRDSPEPCDGYVTADPGVFPLIRVADCVPVLLAGGREDGTPVVCAVHAGWRGTVAGICAAAVGAMRDMGAVPSSIRAALGDKKSLRIFIIMPNTAISIGASMTFIVPVVSDAKSAEQVRTVFAAMGDAMVITEKQLPAATALASCGIAYAMRYVRAASEGGVELGFKADLAETIVLQTMRGAVDLLKASGNHPEAEIDKVTTPGGLTIKGLNAMEEAGFTNSVIRGLKASVK